ncbi:MAG: type II toxin-antitoxin system VapC family toxin [Spirochaetota bacterium]
MTLGVDTSVLVAAVHANHPLHIAASAWLDDALSSHDVVVAHHSVIEAYAVLTRLPGGRRLMPDEAVMAIRETLEGNARIAPFAATSIWDTLAAVADAPAAGGATYDAFIIHVLATAGVDAIVTYNVNDFRRLARGQRVLDPSET